MKKIFFSKIIIITLVIILTSVFGYAGWLGKIENKKLNTKNQLLQKDIDILKKQFDELRAEKDQLKQGFEKKVEDLEMQILDYQQREINSIDEIDTSNWKTWNSNDYGSCDPMLYYCYSPSYYWGVTFKYPIDLKNGGYQDMGGSVLLYSNHSDHINEKIYFSCDTKINESIDEGLNTFKSLPYYILVEKKNFSFGEYQGIEAILTISKDAPDIRRIDLDKYRYLRFYMEDDVKTCEIEASIKIDRSILKKIISSFKSIPLTPQIVPLKK